jgi:hypothetical protein
MPFPPTIPVIDMVSERNFPDSVRHARWTACHKLFADAQPNRRGITAYGSGHVIFRDNPSLVISAIVKIYSGTLDKEQREKIMRRSLSYNFEDQVKKLHPAAAGN